LSARQREDAEVGWFWAVRSPAGTTARHADPAPHAWWLAQFAVRSGGASGSCHDLGNS